MGYEVKELNAIAEMYQVLRRKLESLPQYPTGVNVANWLKSSAIACLELQRNVLGISVLGFIAIDLIDRKLVRLFDSGDVAEGFVLPFAWKREHESVDTDLLNYLFTTWRKQESIGREGQPLPRDAYPPEYVFHLCGDRRARSVSCGTDPRYSYAEIDMHYVSAGEVLFFLTAWRILLRSCVSRRKFGQSPSAVGGADASASGGTACIWEQIPVGMLSPRERFLLQSIKSLSNRRVLDAWKKTISRYDTFLPEPLGTLRDWEWLGIVSKDERKEHTWHFEPEFRHLVLFIQRFSAVPDLSRSVSALLENFQTGSLITESAGNQLIHLILDCFTALVGGQNDQRHTALAEPLLNRLHCFARFPVIPYFYWSVLDEDVKAHLAIPVAESPRRAIRVHGALDSEPEFSWTSYADTCESPPNKLSDTSCVALLGVRPLHCLEPTVERANLGTAKHFEADTLRLLCIRDYSSTLARPVIDEAVYGSVLFDSYQRHMFAAFTRRIHSAKTQVVSCKDRIQESLTLVRDLPKPSVMIALEKELEKAAKAIESSAGSLNFLLRRTGYRREKAEVVGPLVLRDIVEATKAAYRMYRFWQPRRYCKHL